MPPKTPAERQKKYRDKLKAENPQKYEERRLKHLEKVKENIKKKKMSITEAEKLEQLRKWREQNAERAKKRIEEKRVQGSSKTDNKTSSHTSNNTEKNIDKKARLQDLIEENMELKRKNANLRRQNCRYKREIINLKQRLRQNNSNEPAIVTTIGDETPNTKTNIFLEATIPTVSADEKEKVKKKLVLLNILTESIKINYEKADTKEKKDVLKNLAAHETVNKYKQKTNIAKVLGLKGRIRFIQAKKKTLKYAQELKAFFKREDVSQPTAGKNECITRNKNKMQKRYLTEPLYKLHKKYRAEGGRASFQTFCRFRPFFVVHPKIQDRNTCACIKHTNILFKTIALKRLGVLQSSNLVDILKEVTCSTSFQCFYSECLDCKNKIPTLNSTIDTSLPIQWQQWKIITHTYTKVTKGKCEEKQTKKYAKIIVKDTVDNLIKEFLKDLKQFKIHHYNVNHQYQSWKKCIKNLEDDEVVLVCDFSENFACKQAEEIQAVHFGASRNQITLHTSVLYTKNQKPLSICSISPINEHGPGAIWAHLDPIAHYCTKELKAKKIHVFSDSPATQYRQKNNFYMFQKRCSDYGFQFGTWNFFEASHGKGPADGVGGAIKRQLDSQIAHGHDITDAMEAYEYLKNSNTKVKIFYIHENKVDEMTKMIPNDVVPIQGTMKVHQIATNRDGWIKYKWLSCFDCEKNTYCDCYYTKEHQLIKTNTLAATSPKNKKNESHGKQSKSIKKDSSKKAQKRQEMQTREVPAKKRKRSKSSTSTCTSISNDAMSIYSDSDCIDFVEEENETEVETDNEYENTTKENKNGKVTILSSIRITPENHNNVNLQTFDPLKLQKIDKNFDLFTVYNTEHKEENVMNKNDNKVLKLASICLKVLMDEKNMMSKNDKATENIADEKNPYLKRATKETNIENTGDRETKNIKHYRDGYIVMTENTEKDNKTKKHRLTEDDKENGSTYLKTAIKKKTKKSNRNKDYKEIEDVKDNEGTYLNTVKTEKKYKDKNEQETEDVEDNEGTYLETMTKERKIINGDGHVQEIKEIFVGPITKEEFNKNDVNIETEDNQNNEYFKLGDTVLVRYYKKTWKYYAGVITRIHDEKMYSITYYKSRGKEVNVKFVVPKIKDVDCIPQVNIVKKLELIKKEGSLSLVNVEDAIYF